jgi:hypothetical protein
MKTLQLLGVLILVFLFTTCSSGGKFGTPQSTFDNLVAAIKARDLEAYRACWYPERAEQEGQVGKLQENPRMWDELNAMFTGPLKLVEEGSRDDDGKTIKKFNVESPEVEDGIGTMAMIKDGDKWLMYSW